MPARTLGCNPTEPDGLCKIMLPTVCLWHLPEVGLHAAEQKKIIGSYAQKYLTECHEAGNQNHFVGGDVLELEPIKVKNSPKERMIRKADLYKEIKKVWVLSLSLTRLLLAPLGARLGSRMLMREVRCGSEVAPLVALKDGSVRRTNARESDILSRDTAFA